MFFIYLQGRVFDGSKIATNFNPLKICVTLKYDYERTYHKSLTLKILFYPTKFLESRSFPGAFPLELPWIHWGPQDPLPTTDTPSSNPGSSLVSYHIVTVALRKILGSNCALEVCHLSTKYLLRFTSYNPEDNTTELS